MIAKMAVNKYRTSTETLDAVYNEWRARNTRITPHHRIWPRSYQHTYRLDGVNQLFEQWVTEQGGEIRQENKRRVIEFADEGLRLQFVLSWT